MSIIQSINSKTDCDLTLIIPVRDEQESILQLLVEIESVVIANYLVLIIYDDNNDGTLIKRKEILKRWDNIEFIKNQFDIGIVGAFRTGFENCKTEFVVPIMADLSDQPETINSLYSKIKEGHVLVVASRYMKGGSKQGGPKLKYLLSIASNLLLFKITDIGLHDITNAFIMYRKSFIETIEITTSGGFEVTMEIISKAYVAELSMAEVPTTNRNREHGESKFMLLRWITKYIHWYIVVIGHFIKKRVTRLLTKVK